MGKTEGRGFLPKRTGVEIKQWSDHRKSPVDFAIFYRKQIMNKLIFIGVALFAGLLVEGIWWDVPVTYMSSMSFALFEVFQ